MDQKGWRTDRLIGFVGFSLGFGLFGGCGQSLCSIRGKFHIDTSDLSRKSSI